MIVDCRGSFERSGLAGWVFPAMTTNLFDSICYVWSETFILDSRFSCHVAVSKTRLGQNGWCYCIDVPLPAGQRRLDVWSSVSHKRKEMQACKRSRQFWPWVSWREDLVNVFHSSIYLMQFYCTADPCPPTPEMPITNASDFPNLLHDSEIPMTPFSFWW